MRFLTKIARGKILRDENRFLQSAQGATVTLSWKTGSSGTYNPLYKQNDGGTDTYASLPNIKAEKVIITPTIISRFDFGGIKVGDIIFRFKASEDLAKPELIVNHLSVNYYPITFSPEQQEMLTTALGDVHLFQTLICSRVKGRSGVNTEVTP